MTTSTLGFQNITDPSLATQVQSPFEILQNVPAATSAYTRESGRRRERWKFWNTWNGGKTWD
jgi:hypothetical protein